MGTKWSREEIPYDALGDYSGFDFNDEKEEKPCEEQDRNEPVRLE